MSVPLDAELFYPRPATEEGGSARQTPDQDVVRASPLAKDPVLAEIVRRLVDDLAPERIYLFGSKARAEAGVDSDYDLLVVLASSDEPSYQVARRAHSLLWDLGTAADILVWTREAFDRRLHLQASLPATVVREGTLVYGG